MDFTIRQMVGQRLVVGFPDTIVSDELESLIKEQKIANFILFKHNIVSAQQVKALCDRLQELTRQYTGHGAFITIDQEGGMVTRLSQDCVNIPGAMALAATGDRENIYQAGKMTGHQLKALGINFNLAPVADINSNRDNPVIGVRSYGDNPALVAKDCVAMMKGLLDGEVMASAKHFPGHGDTNVDSHLGLPQVHKTLEEMEQCELLPFKALIEAGIPAITTSHIIFPALEERNLPATMSRKMITGLLKETLGFQGLVISDCMEMDAIQKYYGSMEGIKAAVKAGVDLIFVSHTMSIAKEAAEVLGQMYENQELSMKELEDSVKKIMYYKEKYVDHDERVKSADEMSENAHEITESFDRMSKNAKELLIQSLTPIQMPTEKLPVINEDTLFLGCVPIRATNVSNEQEKFDFPTYMAQYFHGTGIVTSHRPEEKELDSVRGAMKKASTVVIATYNAHLYQEQLKLIELAAELNPNVLVFALRNPYDLSNLPNSVVGIAVYEYTIRSLEVIAQYLEQPFELKGKLPVNLD